MTRNEALALVERNVKNKNLVKHMIAAEVCMRALASHFGEDEHNWGLAGLLHPAAGEETVEQHLADRDFCPATRVPRSWQ